MKHVEYPQCTNLYQHDAHSVSTTPRISLGFPWQSFELHRCCRIPTRHSDCHWSYLQPAFKALRVGEPPQQKGCWFQRYSRFEKSILKHCEGSIIFSLQITVCRFKMVLIICFILKHLIYSWSWWYMQIFWKRSILDVCILLPSPSWAKLKVQSNHDPSLHFKEGTQDF